MEYQQNNKPDSNPFVYLDAIDVLLMQGRHLDAALQFYKLLGALSGHWFKVSYTKAGNHGGDVQAAAEVCERAARQWQEILQSDIDLAQLPVAPLILNLAQLHQILMGCFRGNLDDYITALHRRCGGVYQPQSLLRLVMAWCPNSEVVPDLFAYVKQAPDLIVAHAMATLAGVALVTQAAERARSQAIALLSQPERITLDDASRFGLSSLHLDAWMRCSYSGHPDKHKVKPFLSGLMRGAVARILHKAPALQISRPLAGSIDRPVLVVPLETFSDVHAMFRCYADVIEEMRAHFYLVGLGLKPFFNDGTRALFDEFVDIGELTNHDGMLPVDVRPIVQLVRSWQPAAVFYPSLGMSLWTIELAEQRLAPVQVMTSGHPATSYCSEIDYLMLESTYVGDHANYAEKVIELEPISLRHRLPVGAPRVTPLRDLPSDGIIRIAIPSVAQKLTEEFVSALRYAEDRAERPVRFVFFLGTYSTQTVACERLIRSRLRNVELWPSLPYPRYIEELNRCQLHAGTFPFGGTNSLIDSLRQGLPVLALEGDQPHARIDSDFARRAGLPESFVCKTAQAYGERLLELVNQPDELIKWRRYLLDNVDIDKQFLQEGRPAVFAEALRDLLASHQASTGAQAERCEHER